MKTKRLVYIAIFTVLTVVGGLISIPLPLAWVQLSFQVLFVIMAGFFLGPYDGAFSQFVYILIGLVGLPVFTKGGGVSYVFEPSFGYLISFPVAAFVSGTILRRFRTIHIFKVFLAAFSGLVVINLIGPAYQIMIMLTVLKLSLEACILAIPSILIFMAKDAVLLFVLCLLYPKLNSMLKIEKTIRN